MSSRLISVISTALLILIICMTAEAKCTFNNIQVTRDRSGKTVTVSPTLSQCDTIPTTLTLDVFNNSSIFYSVQATYISGPANISVNGSTVKPGGVVAQASISGNRSIKFNTLGDYTFQGIGRSGPATNAPTFVIRITEFNVGPDKLSIATGGVAPNTNILNVRTGLSGSIKFSPFLVHNRGGDSNSNFSINNLANPKQGLVTASPQGSSGVFRVETTNSIFSANLVYVTVPPQSLIQVLIGEAQGQNELALRGVGVVVKNRVGNSLFRGQNTYRSVIFAPSQFASTTVARFSRAAARATAENSTAYDSALKVAAQIFDGRDSAALGGAIAFGSPGALPQAQRNIDLQILEDARNRCLRVPAKTLGFDRRWYPALALDDQAIIIDGISPQTFVFVRPRPSNDCAVIRMAFQ